MRKKGRKLEKEKIRKGERRTKTEEENMWMEQEGNKERKKEDRKGEEKRGERMGKWDRDRSERKKEESKRKKKKRGNEIGINYLKEWRKKWKRI